MRQRLDVWLAKQGLRPRLIGEFDDAALMKAFGAEGRASSCHPRSSRRRPAASTGVKLLGKTSELIEEFFAISVERRIHASVRGCNHAGRTRAVLKA
jgi:LysR family transcriptional activator of nhaA